MKYRISRKLENMKPSAIREIFKSLTDPRIIAFAAGNPAPESFPSDDLAALAAEIFAKESVTALQYGISEGYMPLRRQLADRLEERFGCSKQGNSVMVVSGGQQGLELACKVMCDEGDVMICENPSFIGALNSFRSIGAKTVGVSLEDDGMNIAELEKTIEENPNAKMIYTIPTFHNPAGICTSAEKRRQIYEIAKKHSLLILEDNPYGELRFDGKDIPTIKSLDTEGIVIYCGSFSKILSAGMRVGFVCAPDTVFQKMVVAKQVEDVHTNQFFQMLCSKYIDRYGLDAHIYDVRAIYRRKCGIMLDALDTYMPECVKYTRAQGGLFIWCTLPGDIALDDFVARALKKFVAVVPGTAFNCDENAPSDSFRITYSTPSEEQIIEGVKILADIVNEMHNA